MILPQILEEKFIPEPNSGCWLWTASTVDGYGRIGWKGKMQYAHRLTYELLIGPIPQGLQLDHLCRTRRCINPLHLEPVTPSENIKRGYDARKQKTHCKHGHEFTNENTYITSKNERQCRVCRKEALKKFRKKSKLEKVGRTTN